MGEDRRFESGCYPFCDIRAMLAPSLLSDVFSSNVLKDSKDDPLCSMLLLTLGASTITRGMLGAIMRRSCKLVYHDQDVKISHILFDPLRFPEWRLLTSSGCKCK